ncbi:putative ribonuclease H-like domain-containing protein [Tanacetum coccineum]
MQANCNYHQWERMVSGNNYTRVNYNYSAQKAHPSTQRNMAPRAVLMKTNLRPLNNARPVNTAHPKITVYSARPIPKAVNAARPNTTVVNAVRANQVNTVKASACWVWRPTKLNSASITFKRHNYVDARGRSNGCSRNMTGNMSYLLDFKNFNRGYVTFGGGAKGGRIIGKRTLKTVPRKNNMYSVDMKNIVPKESLTCLVAKATLDESMLWHRRLGHLELLSKMVLLRGENRTLIEVARTMLADSKLPTTFWAEAVNTACYVQNMVLVVKPHNKTPYEIFKGKFDGKSNDGFFVGYSLNSKAFRVYNIRTRKIEENLHVRFLEDKPIIAGTKESIGAVQFFYFQYTRIHKDHSLDHVIGDVQSSVLTREKTKDTNDKEAMQEELLQFKLQKDIRLFLAYASFMRFMVYQMDVKSAFLYVTIKEELQEPGEDFTKLRSGGLGESNHMKAILVRESREMEDGCVNRWKINECYKRLNPSMEAIEGGKIDQTIFIKKQKGDILLVQVYVDDTIFGSTMKKLCTEFEKLMHDKFQMSSMGELTFFLGLQVRQKEDGLFICQDKYVTKILRKFSFTDVRTASTPMDTDKPLLKDSDGDDVDVYLYRLMIRSLMYLTSSRPDIMFVVCACARFQVLPKASHLHVVKRIFSDYARTSLDRKSTTGDLGKPKGATARSQSSGPIHLVANETVIKEWEDKMERAATTASSLEVEQDNGNINRTQSTTTLNESSPEGTGSGSGPRCQDTILGDAEAQIRFEAASKQSNDPPFSRVNTLVSGEDSMELKELMELCIKLPERAHDSG